VGLSTGASTGAASISTTLVFDKTVLTSAVSKNASNVEALFRGTAGLFKSLQSQVDQALETTNSTTGGSGLFAAEVEASQRTIKRIDDQILQKEDRLKRRQEALRRQFTASESLISQYKSQGDSISGLASQLSANRG
jgi:flagellar hook-associated protein 2